MLIQGVIAALMIVAATVPSQAQFGNRNESLFDRNSRAIDRNMNTGNDRSVPLGQGRGEQTGIGGSRNFGGGNAPGTQNSGAINRRNQ